MNLCGLLPQVADQVVSQHGSDGAVHWLDHGTEHPHRIALSVRGDKVQMCMRQLGEGLKAHGVQVGCLRHSAELRLDECAASAGPGTAARM